ncbi:hypothetical protein [Streptosporangium roseum]|uniref:hypothetical protein n=1 Tax=Streptosporangium roseum TaxID=2001 RepID=UPI003321B683
MAILGERLVLQTRHGAWRHNLRAVSNPHQGESGQLTVSVVPEAEWYALALTGSFTDGTTTGMIRNHPADRLWVEVLQEAFSDASALT